MLHTACDAYCWLGAGGGGVAVWGNYMYLLSHPYTCTLPRYTYVHVQHILKETTSIKIHVGR